MDQHHQIVTQDLGQGLVYHGLWARLVCLVRRGGR